MAKNNNFFNANLIAKCGLLVAITAIFAQIQIPLPFTPIPITLQSFSILLIAGLLPPLSSTVTITTYILLGAVGVPVFAGFKGGIAALSGPTAGFIVGFLPAVIIASILFRKTKTSILPILAFHGVLYFLGCVWLQLQSGSTFGQAFMMAVAPFILGDLLKSIAFAVVYPKLSSALSIQ